MFNRTVKQLIRSIQVMGKPLSIHCEVQHIPKFQKALWQFLTQYSNSHTRKPVLYCVTPANKRYVEGNFGTVSDHYDEVLRQVYLSLHARRYPIQLHVHLTRISNMLSLTYKKDVISSAYHWMWGIGLNPTELVLGWWNSEEGVDKIAEHLGLRLVKRSEYRVVHDYELVTQE